MSFTPAFAVHDLRPGDDTLRQEILRGLGSAPKTLPAKYFYDERGSRLFEAICELPEYYPTRTEIQILRNYAAEIRNYLGQRQLLIELGTGSGQKTRLLLATLNPQFYYSVDISEEQLLKATTALSVDFPQTSITAIVADYTHAFSLPNPKQNDALAKHFFFPGSTIGNFTPSDAQAFLRSIHELASPGGLLVGVDLKKSPAVLNAAYNDQKGVTAAFNLNLLARLNREFDANFNLDLFQHQAFYNETEGRIEMHLRSLAAQTATIAGTQISFAAGESIHTENSYKYSVAEFQTLAIAAGFKPATVWVDDQALFSVHYLIAA